MGSRTFVVLAVLGVFLGACGDSSDSAEGARVVVEVPQERRCAWCEQEKGAHATIEAWQAASDPVLHRAEVRGAASLAGLDVARPALCPSAFGQVPEEGAVRLVQVGEASAPGRRTLRVAIVSPRPLTRTLLYSTRAVLGGLLPAGSTELHAEGDRVWILTVDVRTERDEGGRAAAQVELTLGPSHGRTRTTTGMAAWIEKELDLAGLELSLPVGAVRLPATVVLADVDGNPIELDLLVDDPASKVAYEPFPFGSPWNDQARALARRREPGPAALFR